MRWKLFQIIVEVAVFLWGAQADGAVYRLHQPLAGHAFATGTAVRVGFVSGRSVLLTAGHNLRGGVADPSVLVDGKWYRARVVKAVDAQDADIAILTTERTHTNDIVAIAESDPPQGANVSILGYPGGSENLRQYDGGVVSRGVASVRITQGVSGAPVIHDNHVIGIAFATAANPHEARSYYTPLSTLRALVVQTVGTVPRYQRPGCAKPQGDTTPEPQLPPVPETDGLEDRVASLEVTIAELRQTLLSINQRVTTVIQSGGVPGPPGEACDCDVIVSKLIAYIKANPELFRGPAGEQGPGVDEATLQALIVGVVHSELSNLKIDGGCECDVEAIVAAVLERIPSSPAPQPPEIPIPTARKHIVIVADGGAEYWPRLDDEIQRARQHFSGIKVSDPPDFGVPLPQLIIYSDGKWERQIIGYRNVSDALSKLSRDDFSLLEGATVRGKGE